MIQYLNVFFYDIYPYLCGTVFILGSWLRYDYGQYTWRAASSQMLDKRGMVLWSNLFHIVFASGSETTNGDDPRRNMRGIDADWRCGATGASFNKSAYQGDVFWCGYPDPRYFVNSVHSWVNHHSFFSTTSGRQ